MILLSVRTKEAIKVALAMSITYGIALSLDWEKPFWAGLSVAFCSLATAGESINRGIQRVLGTLLAGIATLALIALFPQERWPFLISMSAFIALCNYRLSGGSRFFFIWFAAGFTVPILAGVGGVNALNSFNTIILRAQETLLGVVVYSLVAVLLWPKWGAPHFNQTVRRIFETQHQLFAQYFGAITGSLNNGREEQLRAQLTKDLGGLGERLEGAVLDSDEIWEVRHAWRRCVRELSALSSALERWRLGFDELRELDLQRFIPELSAFGTELETRFAAIDAMLAGKPPQHQPQAVDLQLDRDQLRTLSHFRRAAVVLCRDELVRIEHLTRVLFETISEIRAYGRVKARRDAKPAPSKFGVIDLDRVTATVRQSTALWLVLLAAIYIPDFPNVVGVVALTNAFAMIFSAAPHLQPGILLLPTVAATIFGGILYMFVMPHLSGFELLGAMIFVATFLIGYVFHRPQDAVAKSMGLCMLVILIGVENQQSYSFLYFANWFTAAILFVLALMVAWRFPISFRPEDRFLAMLGRFFRSTEFLLSSSCGSARGKTGWLQSWRRAFHHHELLVLPQRLRAWGGTLPSAALGNTSRDQLQSLSTTLQALSDRMQALLEIRPAAYDSGLVRELLVDMRDWRNGVQQALQRLSTAPETADHAAFRSRLDARLTQIEARVEEILDTADEASLSTENLRDMYRLLGAYRGLSEALMDLAKRVSPIDWSRLREARF